jgi:hypothetical protein
LVKSRMLHLSKTQEANVWLIESSNELTRLFGRFQSAS